MLAFSGGSASKLHPVKRALNLVKTPHIPPNFLPQKRVTFHPPRVCDLPRCGAARKQNLRDNGCVITTTGAKVGRSYVEDHNSRLHATGSPNHGCNECCTRTDSDRQTRAKDLAQPRAPRFTRIQEIVMAKVIEFYMPQNFRKPLRTAAQSQLGKIIEFCPQTKRSA